MTYLIITTLEAVPALSDPLALTQLTSADWRARADAHTQRADALTAEWRAARDRHEKHAIEDFLFSYYSVKPTILRRWHPGPGVILEAGDTAPHRAWRWYCTNEDGSVQLDAAQFMADRGATVDFIEYLTKRVLDRPARFGCFGLHEWAMVYHEDSHRHPLPLRLGESGTDEVVDSHRIACSHFDAFRFFTPEARPLNTIQPCRDTQPDLDQAGCLHANMDIYKWATKLGPAISGELLLDAFELAREIRYTDMQASPYEVSAYKLPAIPIETSEGKAEYVELQRGYAERAQQLRARMLEEITRLREHAATQADQIRSAIL